MELRISSIKSPGGGGGAYLIFQVKVKKKTKILNICVKDTVTKSNCLQKTKVKCFDNNYFTISCLAQRHVEGEVGVIEGGGLFLFFT